MSKRALTYHSAQRFDDFDARPELPRIARRVALLVELAGGGMLAVRASRQLSSHWLFPFVCAADVGVAAVFHISTHLASRLEPPPKDDILLCTKSPFFPPRQTGPSLPSRLSCYTLYLLIAILSVVIWATSVAVVLFEADSSGLPFDFQHLLEMRDSNLIGGMAWVPISLLQALKSIGQTFFWATILGALHSFANDVNARRRLSLLGVYLIGGLTVSRLASGPNASGNIVLEAATGVRAYIKGKGKIHSSELPGDAVFYGESNVDLPYLGNFTQGSSPRHVFHIFLESASAMAMPFSPSFCTHHNCGQVDERYLNADHLTPNYKAFLAEAYDGRSLLSSSSFSIKSHFASMCGTMPQFSDFNSEHLRPTALPCLPRLLRELDPAFTTAHFTSGDVRWDYFEPLLERMGYQHWASAPELMATGNCTSLSEMMCLDHEPLPLMAAWIDDKLGQNARIFASYSTINLHAPFISPPSAQIAYTASPNANAFLNSLRWTDEVFGRIIALLRERGLLENSVIVVQGDHGDHLARDPDGMGAQEDIYRAPFSIRMPNASFVDQAPPVDRSSVSLDVLPTHLDALGVPAALIRPYAGHSALRHTPSPDDRLIYTAETPGRTTPMIHDGSLKLARMNSAGVHCGLDRSKDEWQERPVCFKEGDETFWSNTLMAKEEATVMWRWIREKALPKLKEHFDVNGRYWSDAAVEGHERTMEAFLSLARGRLAPER